MATKKIRSKYTKSEMTCITMFYLLKDKEEIIKSNKTNVISLKLQNDKYRELIKKYEEKLD